MKAVGYVRVSTAGQAVDGVSLDAQRARIVAWCDATGRQLVGVFVDAGVSGKRADNRPGLQDALRAVCKAKGALVVYSLSRLARSARDAIVIAEKLARASADLVSLSESIDTTTAAGKMIFRMLAVLAEFERDLVSERTRSAMDYKRTKRERISRHMPYGYRLGTDGVALLPVAEELRVIDEARALRANGESFGAIAKELTARGVATKRGGKWASETVRAILTRKVDESTMCGNVG